MVSPRVSPSSSVRLETAEIISNDGIANSLNALSSSAIEQAVDYVTLEEYSGDTNSTPCESSELLEFPSPNGVIIPNGDCTHPTSINVFSENSHAHQVISNGMDPPEENQIDDVLPHLVETLQIDDEEANALRLHYNLLHADYAATVAAGQRMAEARMAKPACNDDSNVVINGRVNIESDGQNLSQVSSFNPSTEHNNNNVLTDEQADLFSIINNGIDPFVVIESEDEDADACVYQQIDEADASNSDSLFPLGENETISSPFDLDTDIPDLPAEDLPWVADFSLDVEPTSSASAIADEKTFNSLTEPFSTETIQRIMHIMANLDLPTPPWEKKSLKSKSKLSRS